MPPNTDRLIGPWRLRIAMLTGAHVVGTLNVVSVLAMAPVIQRVLDLSATEFGFVMTAYYCGQATWSLPAGAFVDRIGVGRALIGAMAGIAVGASKGLHVRSAVWLPTAASIIQRPCRLDSAELSARLSGLWMSK